MQRDFWAGRIKLQSEEQMMAKNILMGSYGKGRPNKETGEMILTGLNILF